jgi:divalent metal cation (Fe/Co/Zn/Cd) transporter
MYKTVAAALIGAIIGAFAFEVALNAISAIKYIGSGYPNAGTAWSYLAAIVAGAIAVNVDIRK